MGNYQVTRKKKRKKKKRANRKEEIKICKKNLQSCLRKKNGYICHLFALIFFFLFF